MREVVRSINAMTSTELTTIVFSAWFAACALVITTTHVAAEGPRSVAPLVKRLAPAVVNISTSQRIKGTRGRPLPSVPKGSPFEELFDDFFKKKDNGTERRKVASLGSGFVIDGVEGLVVTNNHVIDGADEIEINFSDGRKLKVEKVLGVDKKTDLALLKVNPDRPLPSVDFGSSERLEVGDWVLAIGNPFGLGGSVSMGIISAKQRDIKTGPYDDYLQTDAAINKGNSGGPLFNMNGNVIGVNTAIISPTGGSIGIGFAVPASVARVVIDQLRKYGETRRGWLGVRVQSVPEDLAASSNLKANTGALVASVASGGPAEAGGLKPGDIIVSFDGKAIEKVRMLLRFVAQTDEGRRAPVTVIRNGQRMDLNVTVGRLNEDPEAAKKAVPPKRSEVPGEGKNLASGPVAGMELTTLTDELIARFKLKSGQSGLVVTRVLPDSPAARRGVTPGDRLVQADGRQITSRADLAQAMKLAREAQRRNLRLVLELPEGRKRILAVRVN
ncbi:MAG: Do family serine endopeptidase [Pseudomonadota bacterium]